MSMADRSEAAMTELVDKVAEHITGEEQWANTPEFTKYQFKDAALPMLAACIAVLDDEPHKPKRGDEVEAWIKRRRDEHPAQSYEYTERDGMELLLDDYRLHADTATPLTSDVDEMGG